MGMAARASGGTAAARNRALERGDRPARRTPCAAICRLRIGCALSDPRRHGNTAFASILALDYARAAQDEPLAEAIRESAQRWYATDRDAPIAYEPSLDEFLSPALVEAVLMQEVLAPDDFEAWFGRFLPPDLGPLAAPPVVGDRADPKQSHLDGLSLARAWCFRRLGERYVAIAERHLQAGLPQVTGGDYVGEHWLASFAALALGERP